MNKIRSFIPKVKETIPSKFQLLKLIALGGVGDVTKNMYVYEYGNDIVIVDCGVGFPDEAMLGIDLVIPDITYLKDKKDKIKGILITHAHDDHIGGLPYIWPDLDVPIYAQKLAAGLIRAKFAEHELPKDKIKTVNLDTILQLGVFKASFYQVSHSIPDSVGIVLETPVGRIIHQGDFKMDWTPINGQVTEVGKIALQGQKGVLLMLIDALRSEKEGYNLSEATIKPTFASVAQETKGKLLITMTSSNLTRIQQALEVALQFGRKVALVGRSMAGNFQVAWDLGYLNIPAGLIIAAEEIKRFPDDKLLLLIAGAQGQPGSSLSRAANGDHRLVSLKSGDSIIFSADPIPSTESAQHALIDKLTKIGVDAYYSAITEDVHVSVLPTTEVLIRDTLGNIKLEEIQDIANKVEAYSFDRKYCTASWKKAEKICHRYKGLIYKVTTKTGRFIEVTKGHSLFALKNAKLTEIKSENLRLGDYLVIPKSLPHLKSDNIINFVDWLPNKKGYSQKNSLLFYGNRCIGPAKLHLSNGLSRLLGYYLAEGSAPRHLSIVLNINETELAEEIKRLINELLKCSIYNQTRGNAYEITFGTPFLGGIFKRWFGERATSKKIPDFIIGASEEQKLNFLGAYINGDGTIDKGSKHSRIRVKTASRKLASDLLYLFSSVGITARLDHLEYNKVRYIGKYKLKPGYAYVIRIQGKNYIVKLLPYLSKKFQDYFNVYYNSDQRVSYSQTHSPEALPVLEINLLKEVTPKSGTTLAAIYHGLQNQNAILSQISINRKIIKRDAEMIGNPLKYYIDGDLLFDPIKKIEKYRYEGSVYDLSVPGPENFLGGFGGIFLHNSGHAAQEELKLMINLAKPTYLMPIGATFRQMKAFARMTQQLGYPEDKILLIEDGQVVNVQGGKVAVSGRVDVKNIYVDGLGVGDVGNVVLRDRQVMAEEGIVMVVVPVSAQTGRIEGDIEVISRGFVFEREAEDILSEAKAVVKSALTDHAEGALDWRFTRRHIEGALEKFLFEVTQRRPLILPIVVEM